MRPATETQSTFDRLSTYAQSIFTKWLNDGVFSDKAELDEFLNDNSLDLLEFLTRDFIYHAIENGHFVTIHEAAVLLDKNYSAFLFDVLSSREMLSLLEINIFSIHDAVDFINKHLKFTNWREILNDIVHSETPLIIINRIKNSKLIGTPYIQDATSKFSSLSYENSTCKEKIDSVINRISIIVDQIDKETYQFPYQVDHCDENTELLRKELQEILLSPDDQDIQNAAYYALIAVTKLKPMGLDPFTQTYRGRFGENRVYISTGHQFDTEQLIKYYERQNDTENCERWKIKQFLNPFTRQPFSQFDRATIFWATKTAVGERYENESDVWCDFVTLFRKKDTLEKALKSYGAAESENKESTKKELLATQMELVKKYEYYGEYQAAYQIAKNMVHVTYEDIIKITVKRMSLALMFSEDDTLIQKKTRKTWSSFEMAILWLKEYISKDEIAKLPIHNRYKLLDYHHAALNLVFENKLFALTDFFSLKKEDLVVLNQEMLNTISENVEKIKILITQFKIPFSEITSYDPENLSDFIEEKLKWCAENNSKSERKTTRGVEQFQSHQPEKTPAGKTDDLMANHSPTQQ